MNDTIANYNANFKYPRLGGNLEVKLARVQTTVITLNINRTK